MLHVVFVGIGSIYCARVFTQLLFLRLDSDSTQLNVMKTRSDILNTVVLLLLFYFLAVNLCNRRIRGGAKGPRKWEKKWVGMGLAISSLPLFSPTSLPTSYRCIVYTLVVLCCLYCEVQTPKYKPK